MPDEPYLFERLIELPGIDVNFEDPNGDTPVMRAIMAPNGLPMLKQLIKRGARLDCWSDEGNNIFHAAYRSPINTIQYLLSSEFDHDQAEDGLDPATASRLTVRRLLLQQNKRNECALTLLLKRTHDIPEIEATFMKLLEKYLIE